VAEAPAWLDTAPGDRLWSTVLSIVVSDDGREGSASREADAIGSAAASDEALQAGYAEGARQVPSPVARALVRAGGIVLALRLAPRLLLDVPGITVSGNGPGSVRLRCVGTRPEPRRRCLERQGMLLALAPRFRFPPLVLDDAACVAWGDDACEYVLHGRSAPRWALVATAVSAGLALGAVARRGIGPVLLLGALAAAVAYVGERWGSKRADRAARSVSAHAFRELVARARAKEAASRQEDVTIAGDAPVVAFDRGVHLEQEGDVWRVTYQDATIRVRHSRGMALLSHLLRHPRDEVHVQTLDALVPSAGAGNERTPVDPDTLPADGMSFGLGDAGPVLDDRARAEYRWRLAELHTELDDAERCNDPGRAAAARAEIEQLTDELRAATGLGGRARRAASDVERVRIAVTRRIRAAIEQLGKLHPALGEHLQRSVRTGLACSYSPVEPPDRSC
jgi:hypothetical protein